MTNLMVDIIYYKTSSDFELEFNLTGCCRMRLFKDKIDDRKELVSALARDVSRSRIILVVTDITGKKNGAETISAAIGYKYEPLDKSAYNVKSDEEFFIPKGALPLVTKSGQFGGCIIECGKQSIIIVSSERALRHEIMRSYIHQYIFDINQVEQYNERLRHENSNNPVIDNSNILTAARKEFTSEMPAITNETVQNSEEKADIPVTAPEGVITPSAEPEELAEDKLEAETADGGQNSPVEEELDEESNVVATETENNSEPTADIIEDIASNSLENDFNTASSHTDGFEIPREIISDFEEADEKVLNKRIVRHRKGENVALLIIAILLLLGFGLLAYFFVYLPIISGESPDTLTKLLEAIS